MDILDRIKQLKDERGWSNYRLAKEAGISEGVLNNLFRLNNHPMILYFPCTFRPDEI